MYIVATDLNVMISLSPNQTNINDPLQNVDLYISDEYDPLNYIFPANYSDVYYQHTPGTEEDVVLEGGGGSGGFYEGIYIFGIYCPSATIAPVSGYSFILNPRYSNSFGLSLPLFGIIGALILLVLCVFTVAAVIARRRRALVRQMILNEGQNDHMTVIGDQMMIMTPTGRMILAMQAVPIATGATPEQVAALPTHIFQTGEICTEDARCSICLDDYVPGLTSIKVLPCGHRFMTECVDAWLKQKKHCPLCSQDLDHAHNVAKQRSSISQSHPHNQYSPSHHTTTTFANTNAITNTSTKAIQPISASLAAIADNDGAAAGHDNSAAPSLRSSTVEIEMTHHDYYQPGSVAALGSPVYHYEEERKESEP